MNNKYSKQKTIGLLSALAQEENLNSHDINNSEMRIFNSLSQKIYMNEQNLNQAPLSKLSTKNKYLGFIPRPYLLKFKYYIIPFAIVIIAFGTFVSTNKIQKVSAEELISNRFNTITGVQVTLAHSADIKPLSAELNRTGDLQTSSFSVASGGANPNYAVTNALSANFSNVGTINTSTLDIDPKEIKYNCTETEVYGIDYSDSSFINTLSSLDSVSLRESGSSAAPFDVENAPKTTTINVVCNFPNGWKYVTKNKDGKIINYSLHYSEYTLEYLGGEYAVKTILPKSNVETISGFQLYNSNIGPEASTLGLIHDLNIKPIKTEKIDGNEYYVYRLDSTSVPSLSSETTVNSDEAMKDDLKIAPIFEEKSYSLIYVNTKDGAMYKNDTYMNDVLFASQKTLNSKTYTYDETLKISNDTSELNVEIKEFIQPEMPNIQSTATSIEEYLKDNPIYLPEDYELMSFYSEKEMNKISQSPEMIKYNEEFAEYIKYYSDPKFNPVFEKLENQSKEIKLGNETSVGSKLESTTVSSEVAPAEAKLIALETLGSYSIQSKTGNKFLSVTTTTKNGKEYITAMNEMSVYGDATTTTIEEGTEQNILIDGVQVKAYYYENKVEFKAISPKSDSETNASSPIIEPFVNKMLTFTMPSGISYIVSGDPQVDLKNLELKSISNSQIEGYKNQSVKMEYGVMNLTK
jgi:hypothetical protein